MARSRRHIYNEHVKREKGCKIGLETSKVRMNLRNEHFQNAARGPLSMWAPGPARRILKMLISKKMIEGGDPWETQYSQNEWCSLAFCQEISWKFSDRMPTKTIHSESKCLLRGSPPSISFSKWAFSKCGALGPGTTYLRDPRAAFWKCSFLKLIRTFEVSRPILHQFSLLTCSLWISRRDLAVGHIHLPPSAQD